MVLYEQKGNKRSAFCATTSSIVRYYCMSLQLWLIVIVQIMDSKNEWNHVQYNKYVQCMIDVCFFFYNIAFIESMLFFIIYARKWPVIMTERLDSFYIVYTSMSVLAPLAFSIHSIHYYFVTRLIRDWNLSFVVRPSIHQPIILVQFTYI